MNTIRAFAQFSTKNCHIDHWGGYISSVNQQATPYAPIHVLTCREIFVCDSTFVCRYVFPSRTTDIQIIPSRNRSPKKIYWSFCILLVQRINSIHTRLDPLLLCYITTNTIFPPLMLHNYVTRHHVVQLKLSIYAQFARYISLLFVQENKQESLGLPKCWATKYYHWNLIGSRCSVCFSSSPNIHFVESMSIEKKQTPARLRRKTLSVSIHHRRRHASSYWQRRDMPPRHTKLFYCCHTMTSYAFSVQNTLRRSHLILLN